MKQLHHLDTHSSALTLRTPLGFLIVNTVVAIDSNGLSHLLCIYGTEKWASLCDGSIWGWSCCQKSSPKEKILMICFAISANEDAIRLYRDLMHDYNKLIRPVNHATERLTVRLGLKLSQLIGVDEVDQVMTTSVWLSHQWHDHYLQWNPIKYGGIPYLYIPIKDIWTPDIVLDNNSDGKFNATMSTKATVTFDGKIIWEPPAIYKSSCNIDIEFFPFDEQTCAMKFSSLTHHYEQVDLQHVNQGEISGEVLIENGIDISKYFKSFIWDVMAVPAERHEVKYACCPEMFPDITFYVTIRRKTLFYTVNLIIPCISLSFLTILVFYLPSDSGEKITLSISILLSLTIFFLLLSELIPPTSIVVPLIGKYLVFTMMMVTLSTLVTVVSINLNSRSIKTHEMSGWIKEVFLEKAPKWLLLSNSAKSEDSELSSSNISGIRYPQNKGRVPHMQKPQPLKGKLYLTKRAGAAFKSAEDDLPEPLGDALSSVIFIAHHLKHNSYEKQSRDDWKKVSMVIDRLFLWIFVLVCGIGTASIILQAPTLLDARRPLDS